MRPWECPVPTDGQTDRQTQTDFIICSMLQALCYSYGTDKNVVMRMHCNLRPQVVAPVVLGYFSANFELCMCTSCYFASSDQNSDMAIGFSDTDLLKGSNNLATRRHFNSVTLTQLAPWPWSHWVIECESRVETRYQIERNWTMRRGELTIQHVVAVQCSFVKSASTELYQIWWKVRNGTMSYTLYNQLRNL